MKGIIGVWKWVCNLIIFSSMSLHIHICVYET